MSGLFGKLCRTCLGTPDSLYSFQMKCVSSGTDSSAGRTIGDMLLTLAPSLGVDLCPDLPEQICEPCLNEVMRTTTFLQKWDKSESALRNMINTARGTAQQEKGEPKFSIAGVDVKEEVIIMRGEQEEVTDEEDQEVIEEDPALDWTDAATEIDEAGDDGGAIEMELHEDEVEIEGREGEELKTQPEEEIVQSTTSEEVEGGEEEPEEKELQPINSVNLVRCPDCNMTFIRRKSLENHRAKYHPESKAHDEDDENPCLHGSPVKSLVKLKGYEPEEVKCNICLATFAHRKSLTNHIKFKRCHSQSHSFRCTVCNRTFVRKNALLLHMESHEKIINPETVELICTVCPLETRVPFVDLESLTEHMKRHRDVSKKHTCDECGKSFSMYSTLKDHMRTHSGEKPFLCGICGKGFSQSTNMKQHMMRHNKEKPFKCETCEYTFVSKGELEAHRRKHSGEHPFVCDTCGHGFTTSSSLVKHKRTHSGVRPYHCEWCDQSFSVLGTLKNHQRIHTGERPYSCSYCSKSFVQKTDMLIHTRIHTGERPFKCTFCKMTFLQSGALKNHLKVHAAEMPAIVHVENTEPTASYTIVLENPQDQDVVEEEMEEEQE